jgi:ribosome-associated protein
VEERQARDLAIEAALAADSTRAQGLKALDVSDRLPLADVFLLATGSNQRQVDAIVEAVEERLGKLGVRLRSREGRSGARWVLMDFGSLVVHVMHAEDRDFYALDKLWKDCPTVDLPGVVGEEPAMRAAVGA